MWNTQNAPRRRHGHVDPGSARPPRDVPCRPGDPTRHPVPSFPVTPLTSRFVLILEFSSLLFFFCFFRFISFCFSFVFLFISFCFSFVFRKIFSFYLFCFFQKKLAPKIAIYFFLTRILANFFFNLRKNDFCFNLDKQKFSPELCLKERQTCHLTVFSHKSR